MKKAKCDTTHYMVTVRPRFRMPAELVGKFKSKGYKWTERGTWVLEKADCLNVDEERGFIESLGEQRWEVSICADVGRYTQKCKTPDCSYSESKRFYDPMVVCALQIGWCPKCKAYTLRPESIETNERFKQWEKQAEEASDVFLDMLTANCRDV